jgi:acyl-CoA hydrolase
MTKVNSSYWVMPTDLNPFGNLFGGTMMSWMDKVAALCAMKHTERNCVTLFVDQIKFHSPVSVQEVVELEAEVVDEGMTSVLIHVSARKRKSTENPSQALMVAESIFKFVALDSKGKPSDRWPKKIHDTRLPLIDRFSGSRGAEAKQD